MEDLQQRLTPAPGEADEHPSWYTRKSLKYSKTGQQLSPALNAYVQAWCSQSCSQAAAGHLLLAHHPHLPGQRRAGQQWREWAHSGVDTDQRAGQEKEEQYVWKRVNALAVFLL